MYSDFWVFILWPVLFDWENTMTDRDLSLLSDYLVEASEHLEEMESLLLRLAEEPDSTELMNEILILSEEKREY